MLCKFTHILSKESHVPITDGINRKYKRSSMPSMSQNEMQQKWLNKPAKEYFGSRSLPTGKISTTCAGKIPSDIIGVSKDIMTTVEIMVYCFNVIAIFICHDKAPKIKICTLQSHRTVMLTLN